MTDWSAFLRMKFPTSSGRAASPTRWSRAASESRSSKETASAFFAQQNSRREAIVIGRTRTDANLVLPSEVDGIEVTRIFRVDCTAENRPCHVRRIVIPRTVKCVDPGAFHYKCNFGANLHELFIPASVEKLGTRIVDDGEHYRKFPADDDEFFTFLCEAPSQPTGWAEDWNCYDDYDSKEHCYSVIFGATI